jgi:hypothetical protein
MPVNPWKITFITSARVILKVWRYAEGHRDRPVIHKMGLDAYYSRVYVVKPVEPADDGTGVRYAVHIGSKIGIALLTDCADMGEEKAGVRQEPPGARGCPEVAIYDMLNRN